MKIFYAEVPSPKGNFFIACNQRGSLINLMFPGSFSEFRENLLKYFSSQDILILENNEDITAKAKQELVEYFSGKRKVFTVKYELWGTEFQKLVWNTLLTIPFGEISTYGEIAKMIGKPKSARAVGNALNRNPIGIFIPCHRVLRNGNGLGGFGGGLHMKKWLLNLEGIEFVD